MSKALETILPDFEPSALQRAAIERIAAYKQELKSYGIYMRTAMELEFMVKDDMGMKIPGTMKLDKTLEYLRDKEELPYIENMVLEGIQGGRHKRADLTTKYEINIADDAIKTPMQLAPEKVAAVTERIKKRSLRDILMDTTCLTPQGIGYPGPLSPSFSPRINADAPEGSKFFNDETTSLHVNISLCDNQGRNLFARSDSLLDHCVRSLVALQDEAALPMLPSRDSLKRIGANPSPPGGIGVKHGKHFHDHYSSVSIRRYMLEGDPYIPQAEQTRIENRLPGGDTDPFVAMAVSMAAMVDAVRKHVHKQVDHEKKKAYIKIAPSPKAPYAKHEMPKTHEQLVEKFESAQRMRELLGETLYTAILDEYRSGEATHAR